MLFALSVITAGEGISQITSAMSSTMFFNCVSSRNQFLSLFSMNVTYEALCLRLLVFSFFKPVTHLAILISDFTRRSR